MSKSELSNHVRRFRFINGEITQEELARQVGVTRQTIIALEAGKYVPSLYLAFKIARAFGVNIEEVFTFNDAGTEQNSADGAK